MSLDEENKWEITVNPTAAAFAEARPSVTAGVLLGKRFLIKHKATGLYLTASEESHPGGEGCRVRLTSKNESARQVWKFKSYITPYDSGVKSLVPYLSTIHPAEITDVGDYCVVDNKGESDPVRIGVSTETVNVSGNEYRIKLTAYDKYLGGISTYQNDYLVRWTSVKNDVWVFEEEEDYTPPPSEKTVTGMPSGCGYDGNNLTEYFHPDSGMENGTWAANGGSAIEDKIRAFYRTVFGVTDVNDNKCLYSLYGAKYDLSVPQYGGQYHPGIDMNYYDGAPIYAARDGIIVQHDTYYVTVESGDEYLIYVHLLPKSSLTDGSEVVAGETVLGYQSNQWTTESHLHIEVHDVSDQSSYNKRPQAPTATINTNMPYTIVPYDHLT